MKTQTKQGGGRPPTKDKPRNSKPHNHHAEPEPEDQELIEMGPGLGFSRQEVTNE